MITATSSATNYFSNSQRESATNCYLGDVLGSICSKTAALGSIVQQYVYSAFGKVSVFDAAGTQINLNSGIVNLYGFTSRELDRESSLYYYRARYYDSNLGRFVSEDPIGFEGGDENLYRTVLNSPILIIDPLGKKGMMSGFIDKCKELFNFDKFFEGSPDDSGSDGDGGSGGASCKPKKGKKQFFESDYCKKNPNNKYCKVDDCGNIVPSPF